MTTESNPIARLTLERLARPVEDWTTDAKCLNSGVDMMEATEEQMNDLCGSCRVLENCVMGAAGGDPVRAGARGNLWLSRRVEQQP